MDRSSLPMIFVADDDAAVRDSLCMLLESMGFEVRAFASGDALLAAGNPDQAACIVTDVDMPGASGLDVQQTLAARGVDVPVIVISGMGDAELAARALESGATDYLDKPIRRHALLASIDRALKDRQSERTP